MIRYLTKKDITDVLYGATLLGGGGGGSLKDGLRMLNKLSDSVKLKLISIDEMDDKKYIGISAGMGAPKAIGNIDFTPYAANSFHALQELASQMDPPRTISYLMAVELGGFNTFVPMLNAISLNLPYVDADGSGRAVPALETLLLHVNGCDTSPLAMANGDNDRVFIRTANPKNAKLCENLGRGVCIAFDMISGIAGWMVNKKDVNTKLIPNAITIAQEIGRIMRNNPYDSIFKGLKEAGFDNTQLCIGRIIEKSIEQKGGFDLGTTIIASTTLGVEWIINFQNENLLISYRRSGDTEAIPYMTVPDIICMYDYETGTPLTNADTKEGMTVVLGVMPVAKEWWNNGVDHAYSSWKPYIIPFGYTGGCLTYKDTVIPD